MFFILLSQKTYIFQYGRNIFLLEKNTLIFNLEKSNIFVIKNTSTLFFTLITFQGETLAHKFLFMEFFLTEHFLFNKGRVYKYVFKYISKKNRHLRRRFIIFFNYILKNGIRKKLAFCHLHICEKNKIIVGIIFP